MSTAPPINPAREMSSEVARHGRLEWRLTYLSDSDTILVETSGQHDFESTGILAVAMLDASTRHACQRVLVDARAAEGRFNTLQIYHGPQVLKNMGLPARAKIAVVFGEPHPDHRFFEVVCLNQCIQVAVFYDRDVALAWLVSTSAKQGIS